jgi:hypothetical protein
MIGCFIASQKGWKTVRTKCGIVLMLGFLRAIVNSERLALIELVVPAAILTLQLNLSRIRWKTLLRFGPVIGAVLLLVVFTGFEYLRSWINFYSKGDLNLLQFGSVQLLGYYVTALNNGAFVMTWLDIPLSVPYFTASFLWRFPILSEIMTTLFGAAPVNFDTYFAALTAGANPEFNNGDGLLVPIMDFGAAGGCLYWLVMGFICGLLYRLFLRHHLIGLFMYPVIFLSILESPRILYWAEGRAFPPLVMLLFSAFVLTRKPRAQVQVRRPVLSVRA